MKAKNLGIFSAIFASICCVGPLLLVMVGLGSLGIGAVIGKYHWWFVGAGVLLIIIAWKYYFKERRACNLKGCQMENKQATLITLIVATIIVAFFVGLNLYTYTAKPSSIIPKTSVANLESIIIPVKGMTCLTCELTVSSSLKKVDGVIEATASAKEGKVKVAFDPKKTNLNKLIEAVNKTGYKASAPGEIKETAE
ncbi:MAG: cation transporter [Candidatus Omnitrophota bacterium]